MNRAVRAAAMGVLLLTPVALSACSAGQVAQTAVQNRDRTGGQAMVGELAIREARLAYPLNGTYQQGSDARLVVAIANGGPSEDTLQSITGQDFDSVEVTGPGAPAPAATPITGAGLGLAIPADTNVYVGGTGPVVTLTGLTRSLTAGDTLRVTMSFAEAGDVPVTVLIASPTRDLPRGEAYDFNKGEAEDQQGGGGS